MAQVVSHGATPVRPPLAQALSKALDEQRGARAETAPAAPNRLPSSLMALHRLGASPDDLLAYVELHRLGNALLPPPISPGRIDRESWRGALGDPAMEQAFRGFFESELVRLGRDAMLREYLPDLMEGCGGAAFHPMIRLAHGVEQDNEQEIVLAAAYWATAYLALGHSRRDRAGDLDPAAVLDRVRRSIAPDETKPRAELAAGITAQAGRAAFRPVLHWLKADSGHLAKMAGTTLALFAESRTVAALQMLAATHALRILMPWFYDPMPALAFHWQAVAAGYLAMGAPALPGADAVRRASAEPVPSWEALRQVAIGSQDDHVIQAVYSCQAEERVYADPLYRVAVERFVTEQG